MLLLLMTHPFFLFFSEFGEYLQEGGGAGPRHRGSLMKVFVWQRVSEPQTHWLSLSLAHSQARVFTHLAFPSGFLSSSLSSNNKDGAARRLRRPSGVQPARLHRVPAPQALLPPAGHDPHDDL